MNVLLRRNANYKMNKGKSSLPSLVACFILGKVY
jgi:hypothetical protein